MENDKKVKGTAKMHTWTFNGKKMKHYIDDEMQSVMPFEIIPSLPLNHIIYGE